jgi:hypothetical protein
MQREFAARPLNPDETTCFAAVMSANSTYNAPNWDLTRRSDGAVVVRVRSARNNGHTLPDAVFAFRVGDPQFAYWDAKLRAREQEV